MVLILLLLIVNKHRRVLEGHYVLVTYDKRCGPFLLTLLQVAHRMVNLDTGKVSLVMHGSIFVRLLTFHHLLLDCYIISINRALKLVRK